MRTYQWLIALGLTAAVTASIVGQEKPAAGLWPAPGAFGEKVVPGSYGGPSAKGGEEETGPYEVVPNWPLPLDATYSWAGTPGVYAESPDRIWIFQRGLLPMMRHTRPAALFWGEGNKGGDSMTTGSVIEPSYTGAGTEFSATRKPGDPAGLGKDGRWDHVVVIVNRAGKMVESWESHNTDFDNPHRVKMNPYDAEKHVWFVDHGRHQILKYTHDGKTLVLALGTKGVKGLDRTHFDGPTDIVWLPNGDFFISDGYGNDRVVKFNKDGKYLTEWGKPGSGPGEFHLPHSISADAQRRIYVADRANARIQVFDENGKFLDVWPNIRSPYNVLVAKDNSVWVGDGDTHKIIKYNTNGQFQYAWGTYGHWPGGLWSNHEVTTDSEGNLYIADVFFHRVQKFRPKPGADPAKLIGPLLGR